jgi:hypothetical protein
MHILLPLQSVRTLSNTMRALPNPAEQKESATIKSDLASAKVALQIG